MTDDVTAGMSQTGRIEWERMVSGQVYQDTVINPDFRCEVGCNIRIGSQTLINYGAVMLDNAPITIGRNV